ncbi:MAG: efflux RND transporter permease subunit [Planctomycetota bacterium]|nr:MAG: efflux RND transporter permease subunit [Planctomycetota bacterium]
MQWLAEVCIRRPVFATMLTLALCVFGVVGYVNLSVDRYPSVDLPSVRVQTRLPGAAPEEVESEVSDVIEEAVNTVAGIDQLRSISGSGSSIVLATFDLDRDIDVAAQDVRDRVSNVVNRLPEEAEAPIVAKVDNDSEPVLTIALTGERSVRELTELADHTLRVAFERADGVGEVRIVGGAERTMNVWLDADRLLAHGIPVTAVRDAVLAQNSDVPGGNVTATDTERSLRTLGKLTDEQGFAELVVATVDGVPVRVRDIGRAEDGTAERRTIGRLDGRPVVVLEIVRQSGANTVEAIESVRALLPALRAQLPSDVQMEVIRDQSRYIYAALDEINVHLVLGSVLASLVVLAFMRSWRSTLIAALAIPTSVLATFGVMWALDFTLNSVTMLALVLMVGIVIDDAIVVLENIFRYVEERGMAPREAAREATREIGLAVMATTLSLVVIFVPVAFMSSIAGRFLFQFGITAAVAVMVSLFVSFTLTPMLAARWLRPARGAAAGHAGGGSRAGWYRRVEGGYGKLLALALRRRFVTTLLALLVIASAIPLFGAVRQEFVPSDIDEAEFSINVNAPEGTSLAALDSAMHEIEAEISAVPGVRHVLTTSGSGFLGQINQANVYVRIAPHEERRLSFSRAWSALLAGDPGAAFRGNYTQTELMSALDARLARFRSLRIQVRNFQSFNIGGGPFDLDFVIRGPEISKLYEAAEGLRSRAIEAGGFRGLDTSLRINKPELVVDIDRMRAADLGISARDVGTALRLLVGGAEEVSRFRDPQTGESYDVRLRLSEEHRDRADLVERLHLSNARGDLVQLSNIASLRPTLAPSRIDRLDRQRMVSVRGGVAPGFALGDRIEVLTGLSQELDLPASYSTVLAGRSREMAKTFREFYIALGLSIVCMYLILASQFESFVHPFTILLSLPLSVPFALASMWATDSTVNLYSALGILVLFGVVKKNSILQIDHANGLRASGLERTEAILRANRDRLRPILMTTLTLIAGMLPLALGSGPGAEERRAVAIVVIGGQSLCLLITLVVTPVAYTLFDDFGAWFRRRRA